RETLRNYEARLRSKDGTIRDVLISSNVRWNNDEFLHTRCFTRDISERKRYEQRLLTQYAVGQVLAGAASIEGAAPRILEAIADQLGWRVGLLWTPQKDEQVLRCEAHWERIPVTGSGFATLSQQFTFSTGVGLPGRVWSTKAPAWISDLRKDDNFPRLRIAAEHGLQSAFAFPIMLGEHVHGVMEFFTEQVRSPDAELLQMAASLGYQIGEFLQRTRAQQHLAEREESYRVLTETASDGIITIDATSTILFANTAAARMFGYTAEELIGADLTVLMPEHLRAHHKTAIAAYLDTGQRHLTWQAVRLPGQHRDGYEIPIEISFGEYEQRNKHVFVGVIRDISERKRLDDALRQSSKLESLGVLAGGIAHDFNNLLTGIMGNISLAVDMVGDTNPSKSALQDAIEASERAAHLTKQLLAYAGKGRFVIEATDISALVREISALIQSSIPKHVTLRLDLQQPLPLVDADVAQLQQLIMNLVINGAEAIPEHRQGTVLVITRAQEVDAQYLETLGAAHVVPGNYVAINVHDNGVGMDEATLSKIFDPFFTTKFTGRGLGLAAAGGIVRGHKGALKVFSSPGQGTTFKVLLPVGAAVRNKPLPQSVHSDLAGRGMVLVVDDEPIVRKIATTSLERYGYTVVTAENGREGVERFRELYSQLKIVILDMTMPVMSGEEALHQMRLINPQVPVVLSSGYNEAEAVGRFAGKGLAGFLQKPYTAAALAQKVQTILREAQDLTTQ
ncbi:MAG: Chemotaxis protein methyltransferase CheR, partial [Bryobacterales bacterium]|nr:Chemotaxis protein methyltransferase CheR [Bryobacterales bacterium]